MKKTSVSILRLGILVGILFVLPSITKGPQALGNCQTFNTDTFDCPTCCTQDNNTFDNNVVTPNGTGIQSIQNTDYSCGTAVVGGCSSACSGTYPQAVPDSSCCIVEGFACDPNEPCCPGTSCQGGTCTCTPSGNPPYCGTGEADQWDTSTCSWTCVPTGNSPILIDVFGNGFQLTSAANGVHFDISGTGTSTQIGWTAPGSGDAFLCLPDGDGGCDDGKDLFGNFTPQPPSDHPNGFAALAVYDDPKNRGNGDGVIDSRDAIFASLRLWIDANHDGISQSEELHTLPSLGVISISLAYSLSERTDRYGNRFRYRAEVNAADPNASRVDRTAYDVFFVGLNPAGVTKNLLNPARK